MRRKEAGRQEPFVDWRADQVYFSSLDRMYYLLSMVCLSLLVSTPHVNCSWSVMVSPTSQAKESEEQICTQREV